MKILHCAQPVDGGVAKVVATLAADQRARGWHPVVACPGFGELPEHVADSGIELRRWDAGRSPGPAVLRETRDLNRIVGEVAPDVVHLHGSKAGLAGRLAIRGRIPTVFQPHLWSFDSEPGPTVAPARIWERVAARWTARFICVSDDEYRTGRAAGITGSFVIVPNGVDTERIMPREQSAVRCELGIDGDGPVAVCVGRLATLKGQDMLLQAWPAVLAAVPDARLLFVGDGPLRAQLRDDHPIAQDPSVTWVGWSTRTTDYMTTADVVVVPSRAEGMALTPLEAMATGRSVVAFAAGGIEQTLGSGCGAVLPIGDVDGLAVEVVRRLRDRALAADEGARGRDRVATHFDVDVVTGRVAELMESVGR